eukprot:scaffold12627_cov45-Isochrysis_galbana.AAC.1
MQACTAEGNDRIAKLGPNVLGPLHPCAIDVINTMRDVSGLDEVREKTRAGIDARRNRRAQEWTRAGMDARRNRRAQE